MWSEDTILDLEGNDNAQINLSKAQMLERKRWRSAKLPQHFEKRWWTGILGN
jgi:hypothetical protein